MTSKGAALGVARRARPHDFLKFAPTRATLEVRATLTLNFNKIWIAILEILCLFVSLELNSGVARAT